MSVLFAAVAAGPAGQGAPMLSMTCLPASETVFWEALSNKGPRLVADTRQYMEVRHGLCENISILSK